MSGCPVPQDHKYFDYVEDLVEKAKYSDVRKKFAACIIKGKKIYSLGTNYHQLKNSISIHAEISTLHNLDKSIIQISKKQKNLDILIIRINDTNKLKNSRPCKNCFNSLKNFGISRVFYSNTNGEIVFENVDEMIVDHYSSGFMFIHPEIFPYYVKS